MYRGGDVVRGVFECIREEEWKYLLWGWEGPCDGTIRLGGIRKINECGIELPRLVALMCGSLAVDDARLSDTAEYTYMYLRGWYEREVLGDWNSIVRRSMNWPAELSQQPYMWPF